MQFDVVPLVGVGRVRLGMARASVSSALGETPRAFRKTSTSVESTDAFFESSFQVFYKENIAEFIELSKSEAFEVTFRGLDVFATPAEDLVKTLQALAHFDAADPELGYSYIFPSLELALWRPVVPETATDQAGKFFSTIGIGRKGYFSRRGAG